MPHKNWKSKSSYEKRKPVAKAPRQRIGDYRVFIGAFPTGELAAQIQTLREDIDDKTAKITAPHVTLAGTYWRNGKPTAAGAQGLIDKLDTLSGKLKAFELQLGGIQTFGERVIYLGTATTEPMLAVRRALINTIGEDKHRRFKPHLTLAMRLEQPDFDETLALLRESEWENGRFSAPITQLHLMQRGENDPAWRSIHTIDLVG
ncbi:MAG: 2'-5' RNA ligase family protein [Anaerolineae bacterium]|nr:2'-5' RNA ligase family protein [Anaerolineae bacterium]